MSSLGRRLVSYCAFVMGAALGLPGSAAAVEPKPPVEISGSPGNGVTVKVGDVFSFNARSRIQLRYQINVPPADDQGERDFQQIVNIGTARLWFSGHVYRPELTYMIQLAIAGRDYRDGATSPIFDAYIDWKIHRDFNVRAGQFFVPFDRLRTVREFALQMADRPVPVGELTLDRDAGITLYSENFLGKESPVAWRLSAFGGGGTNLTTSREPGALLVGRLELRPLGKIDDDSEGDLDRRRKPAVALGGAFAANYNTNRLRSTTGATFLGGTTDYLHAAADVVFKWRGFALQGEYLWKRADVDRIESTDEDGNARTEYTRSGQGTVVQASYVFDPPIEIVARFSRLYAFGGTDPKLVSEVQSRGQEVGVGLNYYFNKHKMKLQADWIARMPHDFDFEKANHVAHLQLDATF
ncbi:porin [Polyangium sorediatum]|nr:porin [Polyangium sorediatum]